MPRPGLKSLGSALIVTMASATAAAQTPAPNAGAVGEQYIVVRRGEFLSAIARDYGVPIEVLIAANHLRPPYRLMIGQRLATRPSPPAQSPASAIAASPAPRPAAAAAPVASRLPPPPDTAPAISPASQPMTVGPVSEKASEPAGFPAPSIRSDPVETAEDDSVAGTRRRPGRDREKGPVLANPIDGGVGPIEIPTSLLIAGELMTVAAALWFVTR